MAIYEVFSQSVTLKYKSTLCSKSAIFSFAATFLSITIPFLAAYRSHGFWLRSSSYREQPRVHFKHDFLLYLETDRPDFPIQCSNLPVSQEYNYCSVVKSREADSNQDGLFDELFMDVEIDIPNNLSIFSVQLFLVFDYILQKQCMLHMESAGFLQFTSGLPIGKLDVIGDLKLVQKRLLRNKGKDTTYNNSVFGLTQDAAIFTMEEAVARYAAREVTTNIQNVYQMWTRGVLMNEPFTMSVNIKYPEEIIHYRPTFGQIMKWAWMQYLALLIIFLHIFRLTLLASQICYGMLFIKFLIWIFCPFALNR